MIEMKEYAVWHKDDTYLIHATSAIKAIQYAIGYHHEFVDASAWNYMPMQEYSDKVQNKIRESALSLNSIYPSYI
jgi:hypothetical protein